MQSLLADLGVSFTKFPTCAVPGRAHCRLPQGNDRDDAKRFSTAASPPVDPLVYPAQTGKACTPGTTQPSHRLRDTSRVTRYGYARVSTRSQKMTPVRCVAVAGCERIWTDTGQLP